MLPSNNDNEIVSVRGRTLYIHLFEKLIVKIGSYTGPPDGYNFIIILSTGKHCLYTYKSRLQFTPYLLMGLLLRSAVGKTHDLRSDL